MKKHLAFSLLELSIVMLIVGVLTASVTRGQKLLDKAKLQSARTLTQSSPINHIEDVVLWLEATSEDSFDNYNAIDDNDTVTTWNDINGQVVTKLDVTQSSSDSAKPTYVRKGINDLPALKFDGSNDYLSGTAPLPYEDDSFTMIGVFKPSEVKVSTVFEQNASGVSLGRRAALLTRADGKYGFSGQNNDYSGPQSYSTDNTYIAMIIADGDDSGYMYIYSNGAEKSSSFNFTRQKIGKYGFYVGKKVNNNEYFNGYIGEIILLDRVITESEREEIEDYLSKKWHITLST